MSLYHFYKIVLPIGEKIFDDINQSIYQKFGELPNAPASAAASEEPAGEDTVSSERTALIGKIFDLINATVRNHTDYLTSLSVEHSYNKIQAWHISLVKRMIFEHLSRTDMGSELRRIYLDYFVSGILELYFQWYRHDHSLTLDDIRDYALGIMNADIKYFLPTFQPQAETQ